MGRSSDDYTEKTEILKGDLKTLNKEIELAKDQDPCLIIIRGTPQGHRFFLNEAEMVVGRDPQADISLADPSISRQHAKIIKKEGRVYLADLGSSNGTVINGRKLGKNQKVILAKEDMIRLGNWILKFLPAGELEILVYGNLGDAAHVDPLTRIYNKGYLQEALEAEFKRAKTLHNNLSVLFFDLDHFKKVNDTYGHDAGDYVLKEMCALIKTKYVRPKDVFARYGGEEFVLLLTNTDREHAKMIAENIRASVEAHMFIYENKTLPITTSIGVAELTEAMDSPVALLKTADKALFDAKSQGRNRVCFAS